MRLRGRAVILLAIANTAVFAVLGALVLDDVRRSAQRERDASVSVVKELTPLLGPILNDALRPENPSDSGIDLERVLTWPHWSRMRDAVLVDRTAALGGGILTTGLCVNPLGVGHRGPEFKLENVKILIDRAIREKAVVEDPGGVAVPVMSDGEARGGAYFMFREPKAVEWSPIGLFITFVASTVLLTGLVGYLVTTSVVRPVERLAETSRRIAAGDLAAEPVQHISDDEIGNLAASTAAMLHTLRQHRRELEIACDEAARRAKHAERELLGAQRLAAMGTLAAGIAHEINNPLGGLINAVRMLREDKLPPDRREEYYELILEGLERIRGTVGRVLSMAPRSGPLGPVSLGEAARDAVALSDHRAQKAGIAIECDVADHGCVVRGDRGELVQVFLNLIFNAIDAVAERARLDPEFFTGGRVRVEIRRETSGAPGGGERAEVIGRILDNGKGLGEGVRDHAFEPFFTTKEQGRGSGLGLAIVYGIVKNHGGRIDIGPRDGGGCVVELRIPAWNDLTQGE